MFKQKKILLSLLSLIVCSLFCFQLVFGVSAVTTVAAEIEITDTDEDAEDEEVTDEDEDAIDEEIIDEDEDTIDEEITDEDEDSIDEEDTAATGNKAPVINAKDITIHIGDKFNIMGKVTAFANGGKGKNITNKVTASGKINTSEAGEYKITYRVTADNGKKAEVIRTITVIP